jgi:hypothetical protein
MNTACRGILLSSCLVLALGACAQTGPAHMATWTECAPGSGAGVDWTAAPVKTVTWYDGTFSPAIVRMRPNTAYTLRLKNESPAEQRFQAQDLFRENKIVSVGGEVPPGKCIERIGVASGSAVDIRLITGDENSYDFGMYFPLDLTRVVGVGDGWSFGTGSGVVSVR